MFSFKAFVLAFFLFAPFFFVYGADPDAPGANRALSGLDQSAKEAYGTTDQGIITDIPDAIGKIVGAALAFVGILFLLLMIYGGFTWMIARGNEQEVAKAKDLITAAVIGLIIVLSAYAITNYIGDQLLGEQSVQEGS